MRPSPFFVCGSKMRLPGWSTTSHRNLRISPRLIPVLTASTTIGLNQSGQSLVLLCYKADTSSSIFLACDRGEQYVEGDEASPAGFFSSVEAPAKLSG